MITLLSIIGFLGYLIVGAVLTGIIMGLDSKPVSLIREDESPMMAFCILFWPIIVLIFTGVLILDLTTCIAKLVHKRTYNS